MRKKQFGSYWQKTSAAESLMTYINMDFEGLQEIIARLMAGEEIEVRTNRFANDFETFRNRDDVLTLLLHLGYLTWHGEDGTAHIPNEEIRMEFEEILEGTGANRKWMELIGRSRKLLEDTIYRFARNFLLKLQKSCRLLSPQVKRKEQIKRRNICTLPAPFLQVS